MFPDNKVACAFRAFGCVNSIVRREPDGEIVGEVGNVNLHLFCRELDAHRATVESPAYYYIINKFSYWILD